MDNYHCYSKCQHCSDERPLWAALDSGPALATREPDHVRTFTQRYTWAEVQEFLNVFGQTDNLVGGHTPAKGLWAAAVPREDAVEAVRKEIPAHWKVELTSQHLTPDHKRQLKMRPGDVREISSALS